jgi:hypothetical protein
VAALADEDVSMSALPKCLRPDKPTMCAVCLCEGAKYEFPLERDIAGQRLPLVICLSMLLTCCRTTRRSCWRL